MKYSFFSFFLVVTSSFFLYGKEAKPTSTPANKTSFFTARYAGYRYQLKANSRNLIIGNAVQVQVGYGKLREHSFWEVGGSLLVGPLIANPDLPLPSTNQGFGAYTILGWIASDLAMRSQEGWALGIQCGLHYMDMTQRSIGTASTHGHSPPYVGRISERSMRVADLSLYPGFFLSWLPTPPRPDMVHPDSAKTRIEGYWVQFALGVPLYARFDERYVDSGISTLKTAEDLTKQRHKGTLHGYTITASFTVLLGI